MEQIEVLEDEGPGRILCCECGTSIEPNSVNMCVACLRSQVDITEGIQKQSRISFCKFCEQYLLPPNTWIYAKRESKELLSILLKKLKTSMTQVRLIDASFVWTEPHSKRIKLKMTVQKEVLVGAVLQQTFVVEFVICNQMCENCRRAEAKDFWRACVQVRQRCNFKKTLFYLEQLVLKHRLHINTTGVKPVPTGIDFFYPKLQDARKFVDFVTSSLPCKHHYAQELMTHDTKNNTYDYKHTFCVEIVPICRDNIVCLPKKIAHSLGNMNQLVVCLRVSNVISLIDPQTLQTADMSATQYWREPYPVLSQAQELSEFYVVDIEEIDDIQRPAGHGHISTMHRLADAWVVPIDKVGHSEATICTRTHLGHLLKPGDSVMGFDVRYSNLNSSLLEKMKSDKIADVILVRKVFDKALRRRRRNWKLKRLIANGNVVNDSASVENEFEGFMEDLEEDGQIREKINIYRDNDKPCTMVDTDDIEVDLPPGPSLQEMLNDLDLDADVEMGTE